MRPPFVVYEDNHLLIVDKPAGMLSQGDDTGDATVLDWGKRYIKYKYKKPGEVYLGLAHRLDRPTSGLIVLCRTSKALSRMQPMFAEREVQKTYLAVVNGNIEDRRQDLVHWLKHDPSIKRMRVHSSERKAGSGGKKSELSFELLARVASYCMLKVSPKTGRRHQIRAQFGSIGYPLAGDLRYGGKEALEDRSIGLHAYRLQFQHPVGKAPMDVSSRPQRTSSAFKHFVELISTLEESKSKQKKFS
ncbi:MAG: RluA family pseudouridine synthase [Saprospiraceae bacterium]